MKCNFEIRAFGELPASIVKTYKLQSITGGERRSKEGHTHFYETREPIDAVDALMEDLERVEPEPLLIMTD